jgi:hypothetical protein
VNARPVPGFPGYTVTDDGRVFSTRPWRGDNGPRQLVGGINRGGYRAVVLCDGAHRRTREIHTLVAEAFHGPRPAGMDVRHLDGDSLNNCVENLRYGTRTENHLDAVAHGTHHNAKKTHCPAGHAYDETNTRVSSTTGDRSCRTCARASKRRQRERRMMAAANVRSDAA